MPKLIEAMHQQGFNAKIPTIGSSMVPNMKSGDMVVIAPLAGQPLELGEIVAIRSGIQVAVHRLVRIYSDKRGTWYVTRGDSHSNNDPPVRQEQIIGRVIGVEKRRLLRWRRRFAGEVTRVLSWLRKPALPPIE